jgi:hypothetical protein
MANDKKLKVKITGLANHDGKDLPIGAVIEVEEAVANHLVAQRAAELVDAKPAPAASDKK